jgi:hypothetical protein
MISIFLVLIVISESRSLKSYGAATHVKRDAKMNSTEPASRASIFSFFIVRLSGRTYFIFRPSGRAQFLSSTKVGGGGVNTWARERKRFGRGGGEKEIKVPIQSAEFRNPYRYRSAQIRDNSAALWLAELFKVYSTNRYRSEGFRCCTGTAAGIPWLHLPMLLKKIP